MVFIRFPFNCDLKVLNYDKSFPNVGLIKKDIESYLGTNKFMLFCNGKFLHDEGIVHNDSDIQVTLSLVGGKGGFGSMLRAIGAQIEKTTNREACRDLSGRRLRDINEEQRLKKWITKEGEREAEKIQRRKERIERLKRQAPHKFFDFEFEKEISELPTRIDDALSEGLQKAKQPTKRPLEKSENPPKKIWLSDDFPTSSSDSELEGTESATAASSSKKSKFDPIASSSGDTDMSESSQSMPGSSKESNFIFHENSASCDSKTVLNEEGKQQSSALPDDDVKEKQINSGGIEQAKQDEDAIVTFVSDSNLTYSAKSTTDIGVASVTTSSDGKVASFVDSEFKGNLENVTEGDLSAEKDVILSKSSDINVGKEPEEKDDSPIDLLKFQSPSELEDLGLDKLKSALMVRGLKCGGTLNDRVQRLWKVRGLQPPEYPSNLLAKTKK